MGGLLVLGLGGMVGLRQEAAVGCSEQEMSFLTGLLQDASGLCLGFLGS